MPAIVVQGELSQGHPKFLPVAAIPSQSNVFIGASLVILEGDAYEPHTRIVDPNDTHIPTAAAGSPTVFIGGVGVVRDGDPLSCGDTADTQSNFSVFANGGGNAASIIAGFGGAEGEDEGETLGYSVIGITDSYPTLSVRARYTSNSVWDPNASNGQGGIVTTRTFQEWCPTTPVDPNGFQITLKEEITGSTYLSLRGVGATSLPATAPASIRGPLDSDVSYALENFDYPPQNPTNPQPRYNITDYYSIDSVTGKMTFTRNAGVTGSHSVPGHVKVSYGSGTLLDTETGEVIPGVFGISKKLNVNVSVEASPAAC